MAERTAAEVLAMLEDELAKQEAARQLFEPEQAPEREFEYGAMLGQGDQQVPFDVVSDRLYDQNLLAGLIGSTKDIFTGERREVLEPASVTYKDLPDRFDPATGRFTPMTEETITPGRFGPVEKSFKFSPAYRGITSAAQFVEDMLQDPSKRQEALQMIKQFPEMFTKQMQASVQAGLMGERVVDPETGMGGLPSEALLAPIAALGAGRAITTLPEGEVLGVFGGKSSRTGSVQIPEYESQVFGQGLPETLVSKNTGVFIGLDKQPRVFLGSIKADRDFLEGAGATDEEAQTFLGQGLDLKDVLDPSSDFLLREYPDLNNVKVIPDISGDLIEPKDNIKFKGVDVASSLFDAESNVLRVAADPRGAPEDFEKQLAVSIQNYIQKKEGFAETEQVDEIYESLRKEPVFEGSPPKLVDSMEAADAARQAERDLRASYNDLYRAKEKEHRKKYPKGTLNRFGGLFTFSNVGKPEELLNIADFGNASPARKNQNIEIAENVGFDATNTLDEVTDFSYSEIGELKNKINEIFVATPNDIEKQVEAGTYPKFLANKYREAYKMLTDALDEKGQRKELRLLSGLGLRSREGIYGPEIAPRLAEILNTIDIIESIDGDLFKDIYKTSVENRAKGRLAEQAQRAAKGQRIVIPSVSDDPLPVTLAGSQEAMMAAKLTQDPLAETVQADPTAASRLLMQDVEPSAFFILPPSGQAALARGNQRRRDLKTEAVRKGIETYDPRNPFFSQIDKAISKVKREKGTPEQWFADIKKNLVGVSPRDLEILNLEGALKDITRYQRGVSDPGKIDATDVAIVSQTIDRPLKIFDLSVENPNQNQRFESGGYLFKGPTPQKVFLITQPPKKGDLAVYIEQHYGGGPGGTRAVTDSILRGTDEKVLFPNILTHIRTTARQDGDDDILVIEELQPEVFQKKNQQKAIGVPLLKNKEAVQMLALESMLKKAAESAQNTVAVLPSQGVNFIEVALGAKGKNYGPQYDDKIPSDLKKIAKKYGITYDKKIPIPLLDSQGQKLRRESPEFNTVNARPGDDAYEPQMKALREVQRIAVELVDEETMQPALYVYGPGLRFTPEKAREILGTKIGRAQGGAVQKFANGGMVNNMRKPVLSKGLSGLLSNYTSGPLARMSVPRGTPQGMFRGGAPGMRGVGFRGPQRIPEIDQSAITAALSNLPASTPTGSRRTLDRDATEALAQGRPPPPTIPTNIAIQTPSPSPVTAAETLAAAPVPRRVAATPVAQALTGSRPTDFLGFETTEGAAEMGATAPGQTPFEPGVLVTAPAGPTAEEIAAQQAAEEAAAQAAAEEAARLEAERLAAEEAARIAAEQEAARIQQEQLAAEQLAAQQAAEAAAAAEAQRQAELEAQRQAELEAQRQAEILAQQEAERIAQEQAAQEAAAQQAAAQLAAEQLAAQEAAAQAEAQRLAEEEAARIAAEEAAQAEAQRIADEAAAEAERVRLAQIAEAEKLAEEQRLAELAAQEAARQEEERLAAEQLAAQEAAAQAAALAEQEAERIRQEEIAAALAQQEAAEAAERERVLAEIAERQRLEDEAAALAEQEALAAAQAEAAAAEQLAAEQLAAQQAADLAAQQNLEQQALAAEQLAAQQAAEQSALEAQIAATPDPDPVYTPPTQTEIDQAATVAQTEAGDLFTTPTDTGEVIDRGGFGTVDPVATTTTTTTTDAAQADPAQQQNTPAVITQASDGTFHPTPAAAAAYEQQLAAQQASGTSGLASLLTRPDFDVSQAIADYTSGYDSSRDKTFRRTFYPFQELTDEQKENAYIAEVFKPVADVSRFRPALTFGDTAGTTTGTTDTTGTDTSGIPTGNINTGAAASAPGQYGLASNQMYQCPEGYTLAFVNGRATCKSTKTAGGPGGRKDVPPEVITLGETA